MAVPAASQSISNAPTRPATMPAAAHPGLWLWLDAQGQRVHSDRPPPPGIPATRILVRPTAPTLPARDGGPVAGTPAEAPATVASAQAAVAALAAQLAASQRQEDERIGRQRADNCRRAMSAKATLDAGLRVARINDKGEREIIDEATRAAESQRLQAIIATDCGRPPG